MSFVKEIREIHVEPTTVCQAECPMCPRTIAGYHLGKVANSYLTLDKFKDKIGNLVHNLDKIMFCGSYGEPAACGDLLPMIRWVLDEKPDCQIGINTNGGIREVQWWQNLAEMTQHNIGSYVVFSIDGLEDTNHMYRVNVDWNKLMENAQAYIAAGGNAHWDMLVFDYNQHQVEQARDMANQLGFKWFRTKVSSRFREGDGYKPPDTQQSVKPDLKQFSCMAKDTRSLYLSAKGLWYPCCFTHVADETGFDRAWGRPVQELSADTWSELDAKLSKYMPLICYRSCATTFNSGQWKSETSF